MSAFAKRGACKRGLTKLDIGHTNFIPTTYQRRGVTMAVIDSNVYSARLSRHSNHRVLQGVAQRGAQFDFIFSNSVQTRCIVKGEAQKSRLFWRFSGGF